MGRRLPDSVEPARDAARQALRAIAITASRETAPELLDLLREINPQLLHLEALCQIWAEGRDISLATAGWPALILARMRHTANAGRQQPDGESSAGEGRNRYLVWESGKGTQPEAEEKILALKKNPGIDLLVDEEERIYIKGAEATKRFWRKPTVFPLLKSLVRCKGSMRLNEVAELMRGIRTTRPMRHKPARGANLTGVKARRAARHLNDVLKQTLGDKNSVVIATNSRIYLAAGVHACSITPVG